MPIILRQDRVMADRKISLNELSEKVGIANVNLSKIKTGKVSAIRFSTLEAICETLNCQPGDILEYQKEEQRLEPLVKKEKFFINGSFFTDGFLWFEEAFHKIPGTVLEY